MLTWMRILWPAFLVASVAETLFFAFFDPAELKLLGERLALSRTAVYSIGFFLLWLFGAASSALTWYLQRSADELNRCPLPRANRPEGCPERGDPEGTIQA